MQPFRPLVGMVFIMARYSFVGLVESSGKGTNLQKSGIQARNYHEKGNKKGFGGIRGQFGKIPIRLADIRLRLVGIPIQVSGPEKILRHKIIFRQISRNFSFTCRNLSR
jgi:hypothetical protein